MQNKKVCHKNADIEEEKEKILWLVDQRSQ